LFRFIELYLVAFSAVILICEASGCQDCIKWRVLLANY